MDKRLLTLITFSILSFSTYAQVPNASFEHWTTAEPDSWITNNSQPVLVTVSQSSDAHSGLSSMRCEVASYLGSGVPPNVYPLSSGNNGFHVTHSYVMLNGWYKGNLLGTNVGTVAVNMYRGSGQIGYGYIVITSAAGWEPFAVPISYISGQTATSAKITFTMTDTTNSPPPYQIGSYYLIDDLSLSVVNDIEDVNNFSFGIYPNPVENKLNVSGNFKPEQSYEVQLINATGSIVLKSFIKPTSTEFPPIDVSNLPDGIYMLNISDSKSSLSSQRVLINR